MRKQRVLLIGSGGREHALAEAIARSETIIYSVMKSRNPGIARLSKEYLLGDETDPNYIAEWKLIKFRREPIDIAFIGPEAPLANGVSDKLEEMGIPVVGPSKKAAMIESSKEFMRDLMKKNHIEGYVEHFVFTDKRELEAFIEEYEKPFVVKPVGLTGGKGVKVMGEHFKTKEEGLEYAKEVIDKKIGGFDRVIIEEKMVGEEFTLQAFTDGYDIKPMPLVQDFKRAYEGDLGPNTGGMGSYSCENHLLPFISYHHYAKAVKILEDILAAMRREGIIYKGVIYGQFMHTADGPKVIEINCRFGDPEAINVLPILQTDILEIGWAIVEKKLSSLKIEFENTATVVKYVVPEGYGTSPLKGEEIKINEKEVERKGVKIYYASVHEENGKIYTTTSRSIALFAKSKDLYEASQRINEAFEHIHGKIFYRRDIATKEMIEGKVRKMQELLGENF